MDKCAPVHVSEYCIEDFDDINFTNLMNKFNSKYTFVFKIKCTCNNIWFEVYKDEHPTVILNCLNCNKKIEVYDLKYYPSATKLKNEFELIKLNLYNTDQYNVYAIYEYSDEFEDEEDVEFDPNDISWCYIFICSNGSIEEIVNDETS